MIIDHVITFPIQAMCNDGLHTNLSHVAGRRLNSRLLTPPHIAFPRTAQFSVIKARQGKLINTLTLNVP